MGNTNSLMAFVLEKIMGQDASATICFGLKFEEGFEFPWGDYEEQEWWRGIKGFKNPHPNPYTEDDNAYKPGFTEKDGDKYWKAGHDWDEKNPFPFEIVLCGSDECSNGVLALKEVGQGGDWEEPTELKEFAFDDANGAGLLDFCDTHKIKLEGLPKWYLTAYYG